MLPTGFLISPLTGEKGQHMVTSGVQSGAGCKRLSEVKQEDIRRSPRALPKMNGTSALVSQVTEAAMRATFVFKVRC